MDGAHRGTDEAGGLVHGVAAEQVRLVALRGDLIVQQRDH